MAKNKVEELAGYFGRMTTPKADTKPAPGIHLPLPYRPKNTKINPSDANIARSPYQRVLTKKLA